MEGLRGYTKSPPPKKPGRFCKHARSRELTHFYRYCRVPESRLWMIINRPNTTALNPKRTIENTAISQLAGSTKNISTPIPIKMSDMISRSHRTTGLYARDWFATFSLTVSFSCVELRLRHWYRTHTIYATMKTNKKATILRRLC